MTNKTLSMIIAVILIIAAVIGIIYILKQATTPDNNSVAGQQSSATNQQLSNSAANAQANAAANANSQANTQTNTQATAQTLNGCQRNFSADTLANAKVSLNKFVTFQVKDYGSFKVQLYPNDAPKAVENFVRLVNAGYYDCLLFHRVWGGVVIQSGDPTGTGRGGDSAFGGAFADELNASTLSFQAGYAKGVLAMANAGPNTNSSQFFINLADNNGKLGKLYTIFGKVISGQSVVDKIGQVATTPAGDGVPNKPVVILKATLSDK